MARTFTFSAYLFLLIGSSIGYGSRAADMALDADDIGGVVTSVKGPEAGVWVIAETADLPTPFARMVVTDEQGRYVIPDLPQSRYEIWVRGYGLVDSKPVRARRGQRLDLSAVIAPTAKAAAEVYPAQYWSALLRPPGASEFPGTASQGNGIPTEMRTQQHWLVYLQENCMLCHQLGDKTTRELATSGNSVQAWAQRMTKMRPAGDANIGNIGPVGMGQMNLHLGALGRDVALRMFSQWTDRIARGALPVEAPSRPSGIERNVVVTVRDYGSGAYTRDPVASDRRDAHVNPNGSIYGNVTYHGEVAVLDPISNKTWNIPIPGLHGLAHDKNIAPHHAQMDAKGRVWMATVSKNGNAPAFCTDGSTAFSKYFPYVAGEDAEWAGTYSGTPHQAQPLVMYDAATRKVTVLPLCGGGNHISIGWDREETAYLSDDAKAVSWFKIKTWDETHDVSKAHGWCPFVLDTNGDGKITSDRKQWTRWGEHIDPGKDTQLERFIYGINVGKDGAVWGAGYLPLVPSGLVRLQPGLHPPETCITEVYDPPIKDGKYAAYGLRGVAVDSSGVAWATFASGHVGSFDRRKCKVINGPTAIGQQCPEGWKIYDLPGPKLTGTNVTSNVAYGAPVDFSDAFGLGADTVFFPTMNGDAMLALDRKTDHFHIFRVPYPMGFYPRDLQFRIDDAKADWKGRAVYGGYTQFAMWHQEQRSGGAFSKSASKVAEFQLRPDPLAH